MKKNKLYKISLKELLQTEAYIGEKASQRHPLNSQNILTKRNQIDLIDLQTTLKDLEPLLQMVTETIQNYEQILVVAQHPSTKALTEIQNFPQPILTHKWVHGAFSNFKAIKRSKKHSFFSSLNRLPSLLILLSTTNNQIILNETKYLEIPTVAFLDTSENPSSAYYTISSNNKTDTILKLYLNLISKAIFYGYAKRILAFQKA